LFTNNERGVSMMSQKGLRLSVANHRAPSSRLYEYQNPVDVSSGTIIAGGGPQIYERGVDYMPVAALYAWEFTDGRWTQFALPQPLAPSGTDIYAKFLWAKDYTHIAGDTEEYAWVLAKASSPGPSSGEATGKLYRIRLHATDPAASVSATATLSEWKRQNSGSGPLWFTVREAIAELEVPPSTAASFSIAATMRGVPDGTDTGTSYPTTPETVSISSNAARRQMTFRVSIGSSLGNGVEPVVTLTGCKLRRLTLVCDDAGAP
jgi:hypothetical protein